MNAVSSGSQGIVCFVLKYAIRPLLSASNMDSFARKLLDSENSRMTLKPHGFLIVCHFVSMLGVVFTELTSFCSVANSYYRRYTCRLF